MSDLEPSFEQVARACGSSSHDPDEPLSPPELQEVLKELHPVVVAKLVRRWASARDELGASSAEHPQFRATIDGVLDGYPDGYNPEDKTREEGA